MEWSGASEGKPGAEEGWKERGERVETHILPTPTTSATSWLHLLPPPEREGGEGGRVICEKHVDPREEEGQPDSFISSYISWRKIRPFFRQCHQAFPCRATAGKRIFCHVLRRFRWGIRSLGWRSFWLCLGGLKGMFCQKS